MAVAVIVVLSCVKACGAVKTTVALPLGSVIVVSVEKFPPLSDHIVTSAFSTGCPLYVTWVVSCDVVSDSSIEG